jgi:hypothetical protein
MLLRTTIIAVLLILTISIDSAASTNDRSEWGKANCWDASFIDCKLCYKERTKDMSNYQVVEENTTVKDAFSDVYKTSYWTTEGGGSGEGSSIENAIAANYIVKMVMYQFGLTSLLDAPCGAVHASWTSKLLKELTKSISCLRYVGVDVVDSVIEKNKKAFANQDHLSFYSIDLSSEKAQLPMKYDLILSRDALQHLPYVNIQNVFKTYCRSEAKYLLTTSYILSEAGNKNLEFAGECFDINLLIYPFSFPQPKEVYVEVGKFANKHLLLYQLSNLCASKEYLHFQSLRF